MQQILQAAPPWLAVLIELASLAGLRRGDAARLCPANLTDRQTIRLTQGKTGSEIELPIPPSLYQRLDALRDGDPNEPFIHKLRGHRTVSDRGIDSAWMTTKRRAKITRTLWIHDLRRTLAVSLYEISKDLRVVEQMLGHRSLATTTRYLEHRDPEKLRSILKELWTPKGKDTVQ